MKVVITYGTFDILHHGHVHLFKQAKAMGDYLIVGLSTDEFNAIKGKVSYNSYEKRKEIIEAIRYVDLVIPEENWQQKVYDIKRYQVDVLVMGSDWKDSDKFNYLKEFADVRFIDRIDEMSSTRVKDEIYEDKKSKIEKEKSQAEKKTKSVGRQILESIAGNSKY